MSATKVNGSSPIKRLRRKKTDMEDIRTALHKILDGDHPMTVRQVFYRAVASGIVGKTEQEYKGTVVRLLTDMRRDGTIPFGWIADNTRWMRKPNTYSSLENMLWLTARTYRRSIWDNQDAYVEIWLEKDALAGVVMEETDPYDVPLMVTRGYPSVSYLHSAAEAIKSQGKPTYLYYLGDYDPSGLDITRNIEEGIRRYASDADIYFERIGITPLQIDVFKLPTRPTKKTDTRSKNFQGESVEVDALPASYMRDIVRESIEEHIDERALEVVRAAERSERETLKQLIPLAV